MARIPITEINIDKSEKKTIIFSFPIEEFEDIQKSWFREILNENAPAHVEKEIYLTRNEVSEMLQVSLPTVHEWSKKGIIKAYRINSRLRYKRTEIEDALKAVPSFKYKRF